MKVKQQKTLFCIILLITMLLSACSGPALIYVDIKQGAIISCDGKGIGEITIESDSCNLTLRTYEPVIHLNKKNVGLVAQTDLYADLVMDFDFKLNSNSVYKITKRMGYDRGPVTIVFKTDSLGRVVTASDTVCR